MSARQSAGEDKHAAEGQPEQERFVAAVKPVDGKRGAPRQAIAPALHAVRRLDGVLQTPRQQDGQDGHAAAQALKDAPAGHIPPHAALGLADGAGLRRKAGDKAQCHAQHQREGGNQPAEEIDEFVRGHDRRVAGEPENDGDQHGGGGQPVEYALQRQRIAGGQIGQNGGPLVVESRIDDGCQRHQGQQVNQRKAGRPAAVKADGVGEGRA